MKTTTTINRIDIIAFIAVIILFAFMMPLTAATGKNADAEIRKASVQLEVLFDSSEKEAAYSTPSENDSYEEAVALESMAGMIYEAEQVIKYAPSPIAE